MSRGNQSHVFRPVWAGENGKWSPHAWVGPDHTLEPEPRRNLSASDKQIVMNRQGGSCRYCDTRVVLYPYPNADADHIIPISMGGKTNVHNMQLLCVPCHRQKTARENQGSFRRIRASLTPGSTYIVGNDVFGRELEYPRPVDATTPAKACRTSGVSVLLYTEKRRPEWNSSRSHVEDGTLDVFSNFIDKFRYSPSVNN